MELERLKTEHQQQLTQLEKKRQIARGSTRLAFCRCKAGDCSNAKCGCRKGETECHEQCKCPNIKCTNRQPKDASTDEEAGEDSAAALNGTFCLGGPLADRTNAAAGGAVGGREEEPLLKRPRLNASDDEDSENMGIMKPLKFDLGMS